MSKRKPIFTLSNPVTKKARKLRAEEVLDEDLPNLYDSEKEDLDPGVYTMDVDADVLQPGVPNRTVIAENPIRTAPTTEPVLIPIDEAINAVEPDAEIIAEVPTPPPKRIRDPNKPRKPRIVHSYDYVDATKFVEIIVSNGRTLDAILVINNLRTCFAQDAQRGEKAIKFLDSVVSVLVQFLK